MSGTITVASTTDSQQQVEEAAAYGEPTLPFTEEETPGPSEVVETETAAEPEPAEQPENEEEEEAEEEVEEPPEAAQPAAPPSKRSKERGLVAQVQRQAAQIASLEEQLRKATAPPAPPKPDYSKRPDAADPKYRGKGMEDLVEDTARYAVQQIKQEEAEQQRQELQEKQAAQRTTYMSRYDQLAAETAQKYSDFNDAIAELGTVPALVEEIVRHQEVGPETAYYLAKHPEVMNQLRDWADYGVSEGAGKTVQLLQNIADKFRKNGSTPPPAPSSSPRSSEPRPAAPRPLRHVGGGASVTSTSADPEKFKSQREYNDWRNAGGGR